MVNDLGTDRGGSASSDLTAVHTVEQIRAAGGLAASDLSSVVDPGQCDALVRKVMTEYGRLDILVNTAGTVRRGLLTECTVDDWDSLLRVHLGGHLNMIRSSVPAMRAGKGGRIVNVTSGSGLLHTPPASVAYATAKRAIAALTWYLSPQLRPEISLNAVSPIANTRTSSPTARRFASEAGGELADPGELAPLFSVLSSPEGARITGSVVFCNGRELSKIRPSRYLEIFRSGVQAELMWAICAQAGRANRSIAGGFTPRVPREIGPGARDPGVRERDLRVAILSEETLSLRMCDAFKSTRYHCH